MLIMWGALLMACFMYGAVLVFLLAQQESLEGIEAEATVATIDPLAYGLIAVAFLSAIAGIFVPPLATRQLQGSPFLKLQTALIIRCACFDAVAVYGLVGGIMRSFSTAVSIGIIATGACLVAMTLPWLLSSHERITRELARQT